MIKPVKLHNEAHSTDVYPWANRFRISFRPFQRSENTPYDFEQGRVCSDFKNAALFCAKNSLFEVLKLKHPPPHLLCKESRGKVSSYVARQFFRFLRGVMEPELGGEFAWLKILIIGRTKGVYPATRRTTWER